jgi:multidrug efflux pump subunit AcrA (membrane-fusion protein)
VRIKDSALVAAAVLSHRYITDRFLPDKAIDLVDEAAAHLRMEIDSMPAELDEAERQIRQLEIEREALRKEQDPASQQRLQALERQLAELAEQRNSLRARWEQEKAAIGRVRELKQKIEELRQEADRAERMADFEKAARLRYGEMVELQRQLDDSKVTLEAILGHPVLDFCYPSGAASPTVVHAVQAAGYQSATTTHGGSTVHSAADRFEWTRVRVSGGEPLTEFAARLGDTEPSQPTPATSSVLTSTQPLRPPLTQRRGPARVPPVVPTWGALTP